MYVWINGEFNKYELLCLIIGDYIFIDQLFLFVFRMIPCNWV